MGKKYICLCFHKNNYIEGYFYLLPSSQYIDRIMGLLLDQLFLFALSFNLITISERKQ